MFLTRIVKYIVSFFQGLFGDICYIYIYRIDFKPAVGRGRRKIRISHKTTILFYTFSTDIVFSFVVTSVPIIIIYTRYMVVPI